MLNLDLHLYKRAEEGKIIKCPVIGCGQQGSTLVAEMVGIPGMKPIIVCDVNLENAKKALGYAGIKDEDIYEAKTLSEANYLIEQGKWVVTQDGLMAASVDAADVVIEATGIPSISTDIIMKAIDNHKHIVTMSIECDTLLGPIFKKRAEEAGVIYSVGSGDEPGAIMELYSFARSMGLDVWALGKGTAYPFTPDANPDSVREEAERRKLNPYMLSEFYDGSKTRCEMACVSNATGLTIDVPGLHNPATKTCKEDILDYFKLKEDGGLLNKLGVVEAAVGPGMTPGVFCIVSTKVDRIRYMLDFLKVGKGPSWLLFRPYHLCCMEVPLSAARCIIYNEPSMVPIGNLVVENVAIAKKDLKKGEHLDKIGGYTFRASVLDYDTSFKQGGLPVGLVTKDAVVTKDVKKGELLTYDNVNIDKSSRVYGLRKEQEALYSK